MTNWTSFSEIETRIFFTSMNFGNFPEKAFQAGEDDDGAPLYVARAMYQVLAYCHVSVRKESFGYYILLDVAFFHIGVFVFWNDVRAIRRN